MWVFGCPDEVLLDVYGPLCMCGLESLALTAKPRRILTLKELSNRRRGITVDISTTTDGGSYRNTKYYEARVTCDSKNCGRSLTMRSHVCSLGGFVANAIRDTYVKTWRILWGSLTTDFCREVINVAPTVDVEHLDLNRVYLREISEDDLRLLTTSFRSISDLYLRDVCESKSAQIDDRFLRACAQKNIVRLILPDGIPSRYENIYAASDEGLLAFAFNEQEPPGSKRYLSASNLHVSRQYLHRMIEACKTTPVRAAISVWIEWFKSDGEQDLREYSEYVTSREEYFTDRPVQSVSYTIPLTPPVKVSESHRFLTFARNAVDTADSV